jgi:hypothetical protein
VPPNRTPGRKGKKKMLRKMAYATVACLMLTVLLIGLSSGSQAQTPPNCTLTQGFWKNHPDAWPVDTIMLGGVSYTKDQAITLLQTPPRGDATYILVHQLIAAKLNILSGADGTTVAAAIAAADLWLTTHPLGTGTPNSPDRQAGIDLASQLDAFNSGVIGPGHCQGEPIPTPTPTPTPQ